MGGLRPLGTQESWRLTERCRSRPLRDRLGGGERTEWTQVVGGGEKGYQFGGRDGARCGVTRWPAVGSGIAKERLLPLSGRIVLCLDQRCTVSLAFDLEDDRSFDQAVEERHRQRAIDQVLCPFVEVHVSHQRGRTLLVA